MRSLTGPFAKKVLLALALAGMAGPAPAQTAAPYAINPERVHYQSVQRCVRADTYIVPSFYLYVSARSALAPPGQSRQPGARILVEGLDKAWLQAMARDLQDDFVARLRAGGAKVLTWDDVRAESAALARKSPDAKFGLPTRTGRGTVTDYLVVTPSDEQAFDWDGRAITRPWRDLAGDRFAAVIVPEITFILPHIGPKARKQAAAGWLAKEAKVRVDPAMLFASGMMNGLPPDLRWCNIHVQEHTFRLAADAAGRIERARHGAAAAGPWSPRRGDYALIVDPQAVEAGILRVGHAFNRLMAAALRGD